MDQSDKEWIKKYFDGIHEITLSSADQELTKTIATKRSEYAKKNGFHNNWGSKTAFEIDLEGFGAELAFCRLFDCNPDLAIELKEMDFDTITKKGNKVDVKYTSKEDGDLLVKTSKKKGQVDIYALMTGKFPTYRFVGYATSDKVYNAPITNYGYTDNYTIKQSELKTL
jgi:hypothetical protein